MNRIRAIVLAVSVGMAAAVYGQAPAVRAGPGVSQPAGERPETRAQSSGLPIATMPVTDARVTGAVQLKANSVELSSGASVSAGDAAVPIGLQRGGSVLLCQNSSAHLSKGANSGEMMLALDRGAVELHSALGAYSDVLLTPDLRLLVSGPAQADLRVRINQDGDTCVQNVGSAAPYVTVTEQLGASVYRVQAGQHVMFERGSVSAVVDNEKEPCGCPPAPSAQVAGGAKPEFPLAESEGLAKAAPVVTPAVPAGEVHAQVTIPFAYNGANPAPPVEAPAVQSAPAGQGASKPAAASARVSDRPPEDLASAIKRFFHRMFHGK